MRLACFRSVLDTCWTPWTTPAYADHTFVNYPCLSRVVEQSHKEGWIFRRVVEEVSVQAKRLRKYGKQTQGETAYRIPILFKSAGSPCQATADSPIFSDHRTEAIKVRRPLICFAGMALERPAFISNVESFVHISTICRIHVLAEQLRVPFEI